MVRSVDLDHAFVGPVGRAEQGKQIAGDRKLNFTAARDPRGSLIDIGEDVVLRDVGRLGQVLEEHKALRLRGPVLDFYGIVGHGED